MKKYRTLDEVLRSPWASRRPVSQETATADRVLRSTKLEDAIYTDLRTDDCELDQIERTASEKLPSFSALTRDIYQSFYALSVRKRDESELSVAAKHFNAPILEQMQESEDFATIKACCEGRELPAYEAASEFIARTAENLDGLMDGLSGKKGMLGTLERLKSAEKQAQDELSTLLKRAKSSKERREALSQEIVAAANTADSKHRQIEAVTKLVENAAAQNRERLRSTVQAAMSAAAQKAEETQSILKAWGDDAGDMKKSEINTSLLNYVRQNEALREISRHLGRFRELIEKGKRDGYAYGRGEKYTLELGNELSRALTSELALLAVPETVPLFLRKYQRKQIKQYRRREPVRKGMGDIICCLDESGSTEGDAAAWGKAVALTLLELAAERHRSFALIHFSGRENIQTDLFRPGEYTITDKLHAAETFLDGGTDFETPLTEALRLLREDGFAQADVVFITDGVCKVGETFLSGFRQEQQTRGFTVTGILLDADDPGMEFSLAGFCEKIYRTSELVGDELVQRMLAERI